MGINSAQQFVTTGDLAKELDESPKRIAQIIYSRRIREAGRVGNARVFDRDVVIPLLDVILERGRNRRARRGT